MTEIRAEIRAAAKALSGRDLVDGVYVSETLPSAPWARLARTQRGFAIALPGDSGPPSPECRLEHIRTRFNLQCDIEANGVAHSERLTIVECLSGDPRLQSVFLDVVSVVVPSSDSGPPEAIRDAVNALAELFQAMLVAGKTSVLGLWGELFAMSRGTLPGTAAAAWHTTPRDRYDFASEGVRVEVKTTTGVRAHHFSLEQLRPPRGTVALVISVVTTVSPAGPSIQDLLDQLVSASSDEVSEALIMTAMSSLGAGWTDGSQSRFDLDLARATTRWYHSQDVPCVADPPLDVSDVRFISDLQTSEWLDEAIVPNFGSLAAALAAPI